MSPNNSPSHAVREVMTISRGYVLSRALHTCARLNLADHINFEATSVTSIADHAKCEAEYVYRLLRFLSRNNIFDDCEEKHFKHNALSEVLMQSHPQSVHSALLMVDEYWWNAFAHMEHAIKVGKAPFESAHKTVFFEHLASDDAYQQQFDKGMANISRFDDNAVACAYDFSSCKTLLDIGGGKGGFVAALLKNNLNLQADVLDQPQVLDNALPSLHNEYKNRCKILATDFNSPIPEGYDIYCIKGVLHDFPDDTIISILKNIRTCLKHNNKCLIIEQVIPKENIPHPTYTMDMVMMVLLNGRQRTQQEWVSLVEQAGLKLNAVYPTASIFEILECSAI